MKLRDLPVENNVPYIVDGHIHRQPAAGCGKSRAARRRANRAAAKANAADCSPEQTLDQQISVVNAVERDQISCRGMAAEESDTEDEALRTTKAEEALTPQHMGDHMPFNPFCPVCRRAKQTRKRRCRGKLAPAPSVGYLTCDNFFDFEPGPR